MFFREILKMAGAALVMSVSVLAIYCGLGILTASLSSFAGSAITLIVSVVVGGTIYIIVSKILRINQCNLIFIMVNDFLKRKVER